MTQFAGANHTGGNLGLEAKMEHRMGLTGEASNHKVAGIFDTSDRIQECSARLAESAGIDPGQVEHHQPGEGSSARLVEPESRGILHTLIRAHVWLALSGVIVGLLVFAVLFVLDVAFIVQNPWASSLLLAFFCAIGGAMLGGAVTLRPDHTPYITQVQSALEIGRHVLIVHASNREQMNAARKCLEQFTDETVSTL